MKTKKCMNLNELVPGEEIINILLANDYHNVKAILKAEFSGQNETLS